MATSCSYDCSNPPTQLEPCADVSGIGVVSGYVINAGMAVLTILVSFLVIHDPTADPFQRDEASPQTLTAQFVRSMSDLQILTGLSILISGFMQLRCGLSRYHWQILVDLAWFTCLTHLSCLTHLRHHLSNRPGERIWRLIAMGAIVILLILAMIPTGGYDIADWDLDEHQGVSPADYAICYFTPPTSFAQSTTISMLMSILMLFFGFLSRVLKAYKFVSVGVIAKATRWTGVKMRLGLCKIHKRLHLNEEPRTLSLRRTMLYWPILTIFLSVRVSLDVWTSVMFEVWWLLVAFVWGVLRLSQHRLGSHGGDNDWTFGQIIPLIMLAAPLMVIVESLMEAQPRPSPTPETTIDECDFDTDSKDDPQRDFYTYSALMQSAIFFIAVDITVIAVLILVLWRAMSDKTDMGGIVLGMVMSR
ncbi:hypothetical protein B0I35DRAFT_403234 [Stachybotrys elegans]|uniref:Uncharacterized protein n=1 Tax=Stachybotrys elegans TaxID=80388 RepID=A0A8K0SZH4_9HYPO|nr:hypothetical protein B0I35DRAFT_403234 [Stachybotrys elegans]